MAGATVVVVRAKSLGRTEPGTVVVVVGATVVVVGATVVVVTSLGRTEPGTVVVVVVVGATVVVVGATVVVVVVVVVVRGISVLSTHSSVPPFWKSMRRPPAL